MSLACKNRSIVNFFDVNFLDTQGSTSSVTLCFVEIISFGCADTGGTRCLWVYCVQGTAGLLPLSSLFLYLSHTHAHTHKIVTRTHAYSTQMQGSTGQSSNTSDEREEEEEKFRPGPVQSPITLQTEMTDRR